MIEVDPEVIAKVIRSADGFCSVCARDLAEQLTGFYPAVDWARLVDPDADEDLPAYVEYNDRPSR